MANMFAMIKERHCGGVGIDENLALMSKDFLSGLSLWQLNVLMSKKVDRGTAEPHKHSFIRG